MNITGDNYRGKEEKREGGQYLTLTIKILTPKAVI